MGSTVPRHDASATPVRIRRGTSPWPVARLLAVSAFTVAAGWLIHLLVAVVVVVVTILATEHHARRITGRSVYNPSTDDVVRHLIGVAPERKNPH